MKKIYSFITVRSSSTRLQEELTLPAVDVKRMQKLAGIDESASS